jgi:predicted transcriptional regulator
VPKSNCGNYQRLEAGADNPTLSTIESLMKAFPQYDFSQILKFPAEAEVA